MPPVGVTLAPGTEPYFPVLRELAGTIWRQHYAAIISAAQIDFMLAGRFGDGALREHQQAAGRWLEGLLVSGTPVGSCGYGLASMAGNEASAAAMKIGQLYVLESHRGMGLGRFMLGHVEGRARELVRRALCLQVNKRNIGAVRFYTATGFEVRRARHSWSCVTGQDRAAHLLGGQSAVLVRRDVVLPFEVGDRGKRVRVFEGHGRW
jgi:GNAT superfamily N-acetyltransferase